MIGRVGAVERNSPLEAFERLLRALRLQLKNAQLVPQARFLGRSVEQVPIDPLGRGQLP